MEEQEPCKQEQTMTFPAVHILSILSNRDEILQNNILDLLGEAFRSFNVPCGPYVPNIPPQYLLQHVKDSRPDVVVLVSKFDDFIDAVENVAQTQQRFKDLFRAVKDEETKMVFAVTCDPSYIEGDLSSEQVEQKVMDINSGILKHDQWTIVSWKDSPCLVHRDVFTNLLQSCKPKQCQSKTSSIMPPEFEAQKGRLRYSTVIKDGCILAVLQSDPYHWRPKDSLMRELLDQNRDRTKVDVWDDNGKITASVLIAERTLRKVLDAGPTERRQALQVYSYHSDENTFQTVHTFIKGLGFQHSPLKSPINEAAIFQNIQKIKSGYVAFSTDAKVLDDVPTLQSKLANLLPQFQHVIGNLKGIIIMVIGDQYCRDAELVSLEVRQTIQRLTAGIPNISDKITVMSWKSRPFTIHQNMMNTLLQKSSQPSYQSQGNPRHAATGRQEGPAYQDNRATNSLPKDPTKGYLRYRADLEYGRVRDVKTCYPLDWRPDQRDLDFLLEKYEKTPKAVLEFWGNSLDGPTNGAVVTEVKKRGFLW